MIIPKPNTNPSSALRQFQSIEGPKYEGISSNVRGGDLQKAHLSSKGTHIILCSFHRKASKNVPNSLIYGISPTNWLNERFEIDKKRSVWINLIFAETENWNWKHCSKIIFKCVNSTVRPIFNEKVSEKCNLWDPWTMHSCIVHSWLVNNCGLNQKRERERERERKRVKCERQLCMSNPNTYKIRLG